MKINLTLLCYKEEVHTDQLTEYLNKLNNIAQKIKEIHAHEVYVNTIYVDSLVSSFGPMAVIVGIENKSASVVSLSAAPEAVEYLAMTVAQSATEEEATHD